MKTFIVVLIIVILGVIGYMFFRGQGGVTTPSTSNTSQTTTPSSSTSSNTQSSVASTPQAYTVQISDAGFSPASVTIKKGDTVKFVNNSDTPHWPASDPHPTHTLCPGFDALRGLGNGDSYSFTFNDVKTCTYHDHLHPTLRGAIVVQ